MSRHLIVAGAVLAAQGVAGAALADEFTGPDHVEVGAGVLVAPKYIGSAQQKAYGVPIFDVKKDVAPGHTLYLKDTAGGYDYHLSDRVLVGVQGAYKFERSASGNSRLAGMRKIDETLEVGPRLRAQITPQWGVEGKVLADTMNRNGGYEARVGTDYTQPINPCLTGFGTVGLNYGSKDHNNSYYGVAGNEALPTRPGYNVGAGFSSVDVGIGTRYALTEHVSARTSVGADLLVGDARKSPIAEQTLQPKLLAGLTYTF